MARHPGATKRIGTAARSKEIVMLLRSCYAGLCGSMRVYAGLQLEVAKCIAKRIVMICNGSQECRNRDSSEKLREAQRRGGAMKKFREMT